MRGRDQTVCIKVHSSLRTTTTLIISNRSTFAQNIFISIRVRPDSSIIRLKPYRTPSAFYATTSPSFILQIHRQASQRAVHFYVVVQ